MNDARRTVAMAAVAGMGRMLDGGIATPEVTIKELDGLRQRFAAVIENDGELPAKIMAVRLRALEAQGVYTA